MQQATTPHKLGQDESEVATLKAQIAESRQANKDYADELSTLNSQYSELKRDNERMLDLLNKLDTDRNELEQKRKVLQTQLEHLQMQTTTGVASSSSSSPSGLDLKEEVAKLVSPYVQHRRESKWALISYAWLCCRLKSCNQ